MSLGPTKYVDGSDGEMGVGPTKYVDGSDGGMGVGPRNIQLDYMICCCRWPSVFLPTDHMIKVKAVPHAQTFYYNFK